MPRPPKPPATGVLLGSVALCAGLGTVHGFSVFLAPLEASLGAGRGAISLTYSLALAMITVMVLLGPRIYGRLPARGLLALSGGGAALGALWAGSAGSVPALWLSYGLLFGAANGLGYGFTLQAAARNAPGREGFAMGVVTAAYALGAVASPALFQRALDWGGVPAAMTGLALALGAVTLLAVLAYGPARFDFAKATSAHSPHPVRPLWLVYGGGVLAGLMAIGHAAGIAAAGAPEVPAWRAPALLAACNLAGSLAGGHLADRLPPARLLTALPALSACALAALALSPGPVVILAGLALAGFAYGGTIAAYPAVIAKRVGPEASASVYGRVFTAWGLAGLLGPWLAGALYQSTGGYGLALTLAAALAALAALGTRAALQTK